jgi:DNA-directed RNA polymerase subunit RPC12/RpoP
MATKKNYWRKKSPKPSAQARRSRLKLSISTIRIVPRLAWRWASDPARQSGGDHRRQRGQADLPDVEVVGAAALQRVPLNVDRGGDQSPGRQIARSQAGVGQLLCQSPEKGAFKDLKVADIFMGGGTALVEGSRLGMQMVGNDLNPVAWFVVKQELANVDLEQVKKLLADIEAEVKPQIMPYYYCDGPEGEKGSWTHLPTKKVMPADFDPLTIPRDERKDYRYEGPEIIYTFWAKHGPCQVTGCGHRTPIMTSPVMAVKTLSVKHWEHSCSKCGGDFHVEEDMARMAPDAPLYVAPSEHPFSVLDRRKGVICPHCGHTAMVNLGKGKNKKVELSLLVHPQWLAGSPKQDTNSQPYGGSAQDDVAATTRWDNERASKIRLLEVRGALPEEVTCPETKVILLRKMARYRKNPITSAQPAAQLRTY